MATESKKNEEKIKPVALFIAAHASDIELGAGGTCAKLIEQGWDVWYCVLTRVANKDHKKQNKLEIHAAANKLGVNTKQIIILNFIEDEFTCNKISVGYFKELLQGYHLKPDLIFTHTYHDSNPNHRTAHEITLATFRKKEILCYSVSGSLVVTGFNPQVFVDIDDYYQTKSDALECFKHEGTAINQEFLDNSTGNYKEMTGLDCAEGFEFIRQEGADTCYADSINDAMSQRFWQEIIEGRNLNVIYPNETERKNIRWTPREREGLTKLQESFDTHPYKKNSISLYSCQSDGLDILFKNSDVLISGGGKENPIAEEYLNKIDKIRYIIKKNRQSYQIRDLEKSLDLNASYILNGKEKVVFSDVGLLTIIKNPYNPEYKLIICMGIDGAGTYACYRAISEPAFQKQLISLVKWPFSSDGFQILISYSPEDGNLEILKDSLHIMQEEPSMQFNTPSKNKTP